MKSLPESVVVSSIVESIREGHVNMDHFLQRESGQWSTRQQIQLIDTLIRGYPFPTIYAIKEEDDSDNLTILDGKQRLSTLKAFFIDESFALKYKKPVYCGEEEYDLNGLKYSQLPRAVQKKIDGANFTIVTFTGYTMEDILEIFDRLNNGTPLTKAEKSKPLMGEEMISRLKAIVNSGFFEKTGMTKAQMRKGEGYTVLLQCLMLMKMEKIVGFSSSQICKFIVDYRDKISNDDYADLARRIELFSEMIDLMKFGEKGNPITKVSIAPFISTIAEAEKVKGGIERFGRKAKEFFENYSEKTEYLAYCSKTTDKSQVEGRVSYIVKMSQEIFDL